MILKKLFLFVIVLSVCFAPAAAKNNPKKEKNSSAKFQRLVRQMQKDTTKHQLQLLRQQQSDTCAVSAQTDKSQERCTECGRTREQAAKFGHPHKPPYTFQSIESKPDTTKYSVKKIGDIYLAPSQTGNVFLLPIGKRAQHKRDTARFVSRTKKDSLSTETKYPPYW